MMEKIKTMLREADALRSSLHAGEEVSNQKTEEMIRNLSLELFRVSDQLFEAEKALEPLAVRAYGNQYQARKTIDVDDARHAAKILGWDDWSQ